MRLGDATGWDNDGVCRWLRLAAVIVVAAGADGGQRDAPAPAHRTDLVYDRQFTFVLMRWQSDASTTSSIA